MAEKWTCQQAEEGLGKSSLSLYGKKNIKIHHPHQIWKSAPTITHDIKKAHIKAKLLTGTYLLQGDLQKFHQETKGKNVTSAKSR